MKKEVAKAYAPTLAETVLQGMEPVYYQVIMHNDDFTPLEFVVMVLEHFFYLDRRQAVNIALHIHTEGKAICGTYSKDVAESKILQITTHATSYQHPLICTMEAVCN